MSAADGFVAGTVRIVDHGPNGARYNIVIVGDGYRAADAAKYHADVQSFVDTLRATAPFADLWCGINIHRVDVVSTDSGADDPVACGDGSLGSGAAPRTYFDSTFCGGGSARRLLTCDSASARGVAQAQVVGDAARRLEREGEVLGDFLGPALQLAHGRRAVECIVDLHRREALAEERVPATEAPGAAPLRLPTCTLLRPASRGSASRTWPRTKAFHLAPSTLESSQ